MSRNDAVSKGKKGLSEVKTIWARLLGLGQTRIHIALDLNTSKAVLGDRDNFEKVGFVAENGIGGSLLNSGDDALLWEKLKVHLLLKPAMPDIMKVRAIFNMLTTACI